MQKQMIEVIKDKAIFLVLAVMIIFFSLVTKTFLTLDNLFNVARQVSMLGIASIGMTFVILLGGIDLSTGSIITFVNIVTAYMMVKMDISMWPAILLTLMMCILIGLFNGFAVATFNMPALIVTFATQTIFAGVAYMISGGMPISGLPEEFAVIGQGYVGVVPIPVLIMIVAFVLGGVILNKTYFGRYFYALGGNEEAAKLSGIRVKAIKMLVFALSGLFGGIAGIVMLSRTNSGQATAGRGYEFDVITAVVLGGVSLSGGSGRMLNVVAGVLILGVLSNGMVLMNVSSYAQMVIKGIILLLAVGFDCVQKKGIEK
ncbi:MAG: ABC transporter permease [Lachnospiraceae bacterium]|nr:ABC transporter permease [Lachnospiraceae bacterium]